jgi:hypothetical protein
MPRRCRVPACGRFVRAGEEVCARHAGEEPGEALTVEIDALRLVLRRLLDQNDLEMQARHVPRVTSVAIQASRAQHQIGGRREADVLTFLGPVLDDIERELANRPSL